MIPPRLVELSHPKEIGTSGAAQAGLLPGKVVSQPRDYAFASLHRLDLALGHGARLAGHAVSPPIMVTMRSVTSFSSASISLRGRGGLKT